MFAFDFKCTCKKSLRSKGLYNRVRLVLDMETYYYMVTEYMHCTCGRTYAAWEKRTMDQLPYALLVKFPAILTYKYTCDISVISMLRSRTLGNSSTAIQNSLCEIHSEYWLKRHTEYLHDCMKHKESFINFNQTQPIIYERANQFKVLPCGKWFLAAYARDVFSRLPSLKASITSVFGDVIKTDSTKNILRKLAGDSRNPASWVTNVENEYGAILQCVLTSSEANTLIATNG